MPRPKITPTEARAELAKRIAACERAVRSLKLELSDSDVCDCHAGTEAGITEAECGCILDDCAAILANTECYIRRARSKGLL